MSDRTANQNARRGSSKFLNSLRLLPSIPREPSARNTVGDILLAAFVFLQRIFFIIGAVFVGIFASTKGVVIGIAAGGVAGFVIRQSLGLRGRDLTHGFFVRMRERGMDDSPGLLESAIEIVRGGLLTSHQCRSITSAYTEFQRDLRSCDSPDLREELYRSFERKIRTVFEGNTISAQTAQEPVPGVAELTIVALPRLDNQK